jgi:hypothetical protein
MRNKARINAQRRRVTILVVTCRVLEAEEKVKATEEQIDAEHNKN